MAKTNDTIDGLLAEFRGYSAGMPSSYHVTMSWADFRKMLDRFEAAHGREVQNALDAGGFVEASRKNKQVGNVAKLREALVSVQKKIHYLIGSLNVPNSLVANRMEINGIINAALAEPPRNCDVGTAEEQAERFILFCLRNSFRGVCNDNCKFANVNRRFGWQEIGQARCFPFWAQMPYEEGGAK